MLLLETRIWNSVLPSMTVGSGPAAFPKNEHLGEMTYLHVIQVGRQGSWLAS